MIKYQEETTFADDEIREKHRMHLQMTFESKKELFRSTNECKRVIVVSVFRKLSHLVYMHHILK